MCNCFPTPVHTVIHAYKCSVYPPLWQLLSHFKDFNSGVCHVMKVLCACMCVCVCVCVHMCVCMCACVHVHAFVML